MHPFDFMVFGPMVFGLAFWPAIFFWAVVGVIFVEICFDQGFVAFGTLVFTAAIAYYLGFWSIVFVQEHQTAFLWLLAFYIPIGVLWATTKWWFYTTGVANKVAKFLADETRSFRGKPDFDDRMRDARSRLSYKFEKLPPLVSNHKADLTRWMAWWPFSVIGSIFDDMLRRFFTALYNAMGKIWQRISNHAFRNVQWQNPPEQSEADKRAL